MTFVMSDLKIEKADMPAYAKFLGENPPDNPYSLPPFLDAYEDTFSCDYELLFITRSGTPVASCALFVGSRFRQPVIRFMPIRAYDGVNFRRLDDSKNQKQEYEKLFALQTLEEYLEKEFSFHQMVFPPGFLDIRSFQWAGASVIPQYTYIADLGNFSEENYTKDLLKNLRAAERSNLTFGKCTAEKLAALQQLSYDRHGRGTPISSEMMARLLNNLKSAGLLEIDCVSDENGETLAGVARLQASSASYFFIGGTNAEGAKGASHLLYHEILKNEKKSERSFIDFCGANTPTINLFKSAFGPRLQVYFRIWRANRIATRLASLVKKI